MEPPSSTQLIGVVGPCGAGKSTLVAGLEKHGYACRHIAQEHSYVPDMWQLITQPDILIYLDATFAVSTAACKIELAGKRLHRTIKTTRIAREHANLFIETDELTPEAVLQKALNFLKDYLS